MTKTRLTDGELKVLENHAKQNVKAVGQRNGYASTQYGPFKVLVQWRSDDELYVYFLDGSKMMRKALLYHKSLLRWSDHAEEKEKEVPA